MHIGEEGRRVVLDLLHGEAGAGVLAVGHDASLIRTHHAANADPLLAVSNRHWVGESETRRTSLALGRLVDVGARIGGRLVFTPEVLEDNVPADVILLAVDAVFIETLGALHFGVSRFLKELSPLCTHLETAGKFVVTVDNLVWSRDDAVGRGELERAVHALLLVAVLPATLPVAAPGLLAVLPGRSGSGGCDSQNSGDLRNLHLGFFGKELIDLVVMLCWMQKLMS